MLIEGPFEIQISDTAEKLDLNTLSASERGSLIAGLQYDPNIYFLYRFL